MVDLKEKVDEIRKDEAKVRRSFLTWARGFDPAIVLAVAAGVVLLILALAIYRVW